MSSDSPQTRTLVVALLMAVMVITVLDKSIFAFAGPQIIDELQLTPEQFGFVGSAFYFLYSFSGLVVGFVANRFPCRWVLSGMSLVWMVAQVSTALSTGLATLVVSRMLLGAGCGPATAVTQHACFKWFAPRDRVLPAALIQIAIMLGAVAASLALPSLIQQFGWRQGYLLLATLGLLWLALWQVFGREGALDEITPGDAVAPSTSYRRLLFNRTFLCITLAGFCSYLPTALIYSWVPVYLQRGLGLTPLQSGYLVMAATLGVIALNLVVSTWSQRALKLGADVQLAMVMPAMWACLLAGITFVAIGFLGNGTRSLFLTLLLFTLGSVLVNLLPAFANSIVAFIAPSPQRGSLLAIHIGLMTSAGMLAPHLVGLAVGRAGGDVAYGFELVVGLFGLALIGTGLLGWALIDPETTKGQLSTPVHSSWT